jgi:DNA-binding XRE family transcriptional regulator
MRGMTEHPDPVPRTDKLAELKRVRALAIEHTIQARQLARTRRRLIDALLADGLSQADLARELGVSRQAIQKMVAVGR